jgi:hypothetical protein
MARLATIAADTAAGSLLLQGAALAGETIRATGTLFSAIVILSATPTDASRNAPAEMMAPVVDSNAILHVIANRPSQSALNSVRSEPVLRTLAEQSRGEFTSIYSASSYQAALDRLADRLTSEMMIEYLVPVRSKPNDVKVGVRIVGAKVRGSASRHDRACRDHDKTLSAQSSRKPFLSEDIVLCGLRSLRSDSPCRRQRVAVVAARGGANVSSGACRGCNVLLITIDTLRLDRIGAFGGRAPRPHLDQLASEGLRLAHAPNARRFLRTHPSSPPCRRPCTASALNEPVSSRPGCRCWPPCSGAQATDGRVRGRLRARCALRP